MLIPVFVPIRRLRSRHHSPRPLTDREKKYIGRFMIVCLVLIAWMIVNVGIMTFFVTRALLA